MCGFDTLSRLTSLHTTQGTQQPCYISHREEDDHPYDLPILVHFVSVLYDTYVTSLLGHPLISS